MATNETDDMMSRDGFSSSNNDEQPKKKRMRVGDLRKQSFSATAENNSRGVNPYKSNDRENSYESSNRPSYNDGGNRGYQGGGRDYSNREGNNDRGGYNRQGGGYNDRQSGGYNRDNRGGYDRQGGGYNRQGGGYDRQGGGYDRQGGGYDRQGGGYDRQGGGYNRDNRGGGSDRRPYNSNNNRGGGGYSNNRDNRGGSRQGGGMGRGGNFGAPGEKRLVKPVKYKENVDPTIPLRLNKYLANAGVCSRREADAFITSGAVKVNGEVVDQLGAKVTRADLVTFNDKPVQLESKVYVLLNKPKNCVTTSDDPQNRVTVMDLVKNACPERIYPVGRLDRNTTGVLLLTNDGDLASKLTHPKFMKKKIYQVTLDRDVAIEDMQAIADGIELDDGEIHADSIAYQSEDELNVVGIEIHSGRNRIVRRIFEKLGYQVVKLDRVYFAGLTKKNVLRGKWRYLSEKEVNMLRMGAFD